MFTCMRGGRNAADFLIGRYLVEQVGQHVRIANAAARDLNGPYLQRFLVNADMDLAP
jgi:hypothetical protein